MMTTVPATFSRYSTSPEGTAFAYVCGRGGLGRRGRGICAVLIRPGITLSLGRKIMSGKPSIIFGLISMA